MEQIFDGLVVWLNSLTAAQAALMGVLIAGTMTFFGTLFNNMFQKEVERLNAYYAKTLDRRLNAYDALYEALGKLNHVTEISGRKPVMTIILNRDHFKESYEKFQEVKHKIRWFEQVTLNKYKKIDEKLIFLAKDLENKTRNKTYVDQSNELYEQVLDLLDTAHQDIVSLQNIKKYKPSLLGARELSKSLLQLMPDEELRVPERPKKLDLQQPENQRCTKLLFVLARRQRFR